MVSREHQAENAWLWLAKLITGGLIIVILIVHLAVNHLAPGGLKNYADVVAYLSNPWIALMEMTFLMLVVTHALLGTRSILLDLNPSIRIIRWMDRILVGLGSLSIIYGIWLIQVIIRQGTGG